MNMERIFEYNTFNNNVTYQMFQGSETVGSYLVLTVTVDIVSYGYILILMMKVIIRPTIYR